MVNQNPRLKPKNEATLKNGSLFPIRAPRGSNEPWYINASYVSPQSSRVLSGRSSVTNKVAHGENGDEGVTVLPPKADQ